VSEKTYKRKWYLLSPSVCMQFLFSSIVLYNSLPVSTIPAANA
jgi:hypothetical protein